ncbi:MAG: hypothetical protein H0V90_10305 [Blastocatellia bacterium]|nr:hypothetical protein [Blastocatellia bacterium]
MTVILFFGPTVGCGKAQSVSDAPIPAGRQEDGLILEMYTESKYSVYPPGKILNIKVYESGQAEYDHYPARQTKGKFDIKRTGFSLTDVELEKIRSLTTKTLKTSGDSYGPTVPILDAAIETTLVLSMSGNQRKILLTENHSNLILEKKKGIYPESLLDLLLFIQKKNDELLGIDRELSLTPATTRSAA